MTGMSPSGTCLTASKNTLMTFGGVTGALVGLGIPEHEAEHCEDHLQKGGILLAEHCDTSKQIKRAKELLECR